MKITIFAAGSRGDIQPCAALGKGLQEAGFLIQMAVPENFSAFIQDQGLAFFPLHGDIQEIMASDTGRDFMEQGGSNAIKSILSMRALIAPIIEQMLDDADAACQDADAVICLGVLAGFGQCIAEKYHIPLILIEPTPLLPSKEFAAASWPIQKNMGGPLNHFSGVAMLRVVWQWYKPFVNQYRKDLGLSKYAFKDYYHLLRTTPMIGAYSSKIIPHPARGVENVNFSGYLFLDSETDWHPSQDLVDFLKEGTPPVYIGFGSMGGKNPEKLAELVFNALTQTGQRGLLMTGWGGLRPDNTPENVFILDAAPHNWLFPRMAAIVHHGGAGTTAEALRSGVPMVVIPFLFDQAFWGERIRSLGVGPQPIPLKKLTSGRLAEAIQIAVSDPIIQKKSKSIGETIRSENGTNQAVNFIKHTLNQ